MFLGLFARLLELPGQRLRCCGRRRWESQPLIVHRSHRWEELRSDERGIYRGGCCDESAHTCRPGFFRKSSPLDAPQRQTGCPKEREKKNSRKPNSFFLGSLLRDRHFLHVLNWPCHAVSSTGLPGAECFHIGQCSVPVLVSRKIRVCFFWH